ncbi:18695_t:CDS:1, partial [Dentiscutata erythropus]
AENDDHKSQQIIGNYFSEGIGTRKDIIKAIYWLNKAKENRNISANFFLERILWDLLQ